MPAYAVLLGRTPIRPGINDNMDSFAKRKAGLDIVRGILASPELQQG